MSWSVYVNLPVISLFWLISLGFSLSIYHSLFLIPSCKCAYYEKLSERTSLLNEASWVWLQKPWLVTHECDMTHKSHVTTHEDHLPFLALFSTKCGCRWGMLLMWPRLWRHKSHNLGSMLLTCWQCISIWSELVWWGLQERWTARRAPMNNPWKQQSVILNIRIGES